MSWKTKSSAKDNYECVRSLLDGPNWKIEAAQKREE